MYFGGVSDGVGVGWFSWTGVVIETGLLFDFCVGVGEGAMLD